MIVLLRVIVTAVLIAAPFAILALASGKAEGAIWLMLPFVAAIPIFIVVLLIFLPAERLAASVGLSANLVVPMAGAAVGAAIAAAATYFGRKRDAVVAEVWAVDLATIGALVGIVLCGMMVGVAWRTSAWAVTWLGWNR